MNRIFRVIFNQRRGEYIVSSEHSRSRGKSGKLKSVCLAAGLIAAMGLWPLQASAATERLVVGEGETRTLTGETFQSFTNTTENDGYGGAIYNQGILAVSDSTFGSVDDNEGSLGNKATKGGAIYNNGENAELSLSHSKFDGNTATSSGGAIYNNLGTVNISNSHFLNNKVREDSGSAVNNYRGTVNIFDSTFSDNFTNSIVKPDLVVML